MDWDKWYLAWNSQINTSSQIKLKTSMLKLRLCDYSHAFILVTGTVTIPGRGADQVAKHTDEWNKRKIFENCFTDCVSKINNLWYRCII